MRPRRLLNNELANLIDALDNTNDARTIKLALQGFARSSGFDAFAFLCVRGTETYAFSNYPEEWQRTYLENGYSAIDPIVTKAVRTMAPFSWSPEDGKGRGSKGRRFFAEADTYGIRSGLTIPIRSSFGRTAMLTMASGRARADFAELGDVGRAITAVASVQMRLNILAARASLAARIVLSPRESACLSWASRGNTMSEIAQILGISERSVRFYLETAREKLGARNVAHAVRLAVEKNLI